MTEYRIIIPQIIEKELEEIASYIALDNLPKAIDFVTELKIFIRKRLGFMPSSGKTVKGQIRMVNYKRYNIFYIASESKKIVTLIHIFAGGRNWEDII